MKRTKKRLSTYATISIQAQDGSLRGKHLIILTMHIHICLYITLMCKHFVKNKHVFLLNNASYDNQTIGNEFGIFCGIIITPFHNLTSNFNRWTLAKYQWQPICRYSCHMPIMAVIAWLLSKSVIFLASVDLLTVLVTLSNCLLIMWQNIPKSLHIIWLSEDA